MHDVWVHRLAGAIQVLDVLDDPTLVLETLGLIRPFVAKRYLHARIEECKLLQTLD